MPLYRASYVDAAGVTRVKHLEGPTREWAHAHVAATGARAISITEELLSIEGRNLAAEAEYEASRRAGAVDHAALPATGTATNDLETYIDEHLALTPVRKDRTPLRAFAGWLWPSLVFAFLAWNGRPHDGAAGSRWFAIDAAAAAATLILGVSAVAPLWIHRVVLRARAWRRWTRVAFLSRLALAHPRVRGKPSLRFEFGRHLASAMAARGRVDEALARVEALARRNGQPESTILSFKSHVYDAAERFDEMIALRAQAAEDRSRAYASVDLAIALLERRRDVPAAREALARVASGPTSLSEAALRAFAFGMLAIEERRPVEALALLGRARLAFLRCMPFGMQEGALLWADSYLALATAESGDAPQARVMLARVRKYLEANRKHALIERIVVAMADGERARAAYRS